MIGVEYSEEQRAGLLAALSGCRDGEPDWEKIDTYTRSLLKWAEVSPWDLIGIISDRSLTAWFEHLPVAPASHGPTVYVIGGVPDMVKIGYTRHLPNRLSVLQSSTPYPLRVEAVMGGDRMIERGLHDRFAEDRVSGEWFRRSDQIESFIRGLVRLLIQVPA